MMIYGCLVSLLAAVLCIGALWQRYVYYKALARERRGEISRLKGVIFLKEKRIVELKNEIRVLKGAVAMVETSLVMMNEHMRYFIEEIADLETLVWLKDGEIDYYERYSESQQRVLELKEQETQELEAELKELKRESPEHLKAVLLEKLNENANLKLLNGLLEEANRGYNREVERLMGGEFTTEKAEGDGVNADME